MILHTTDGVGPHAQTTTHFVQELKKNHGMDYDRHGSYRLTEE